METIDPATGQVLAADAIQRVLFIANAVHVYNIPPQGSSRGHMAGTWTEDPKRHIFTCRLRVLETAEPQTTARPGDGTGDDRVKTDILLEDTSSGQLFAAAPYTTPAIVEPAADSSRFFALRVQDPQGRKATLGIGFEERSEAFDFGVALQDARKALGLDDANSAGGKPVAAAAAATAKAEELRDYSLKEGETITVNLKGSKFGRRARPQEPETSQPANLSAFALPPPPSASSSSGSAFLPPPPSAQDVKRKRLSAQDLGFDDGQFGEFA